MGSETERPSEVEPTPDDAPPGSVEGSPPAAASEPASEAASGPAPASAPESPGDEPDPPAAPAPSKPEPARWKKLLSGLLVAGGILLFLEAGLRAAGFGGADTFYRPEVAFGEPALATNPAASFRLFPTDRVSGQRIETPQLGFARFPAERGARFRVFVLGASSVQGFPEPPCFAIPASLRAWLERAAPDRTVEVEVVNAGVVATTSFAVLEIAEEIVEYSPDVIVVYSGHNELHGVWGAASALQVGGGSRALTRAAASFRRLRTARLIRRLVRGGGSASADAEPSGELIELIAGGARVRPDGPEHALAEANLAANLADLVALARAADVGCVLATPASNLHGLSPLATGDADADFARGRDLAAAGDLPAARVALRAARDRDPLHFRACDVLCDVVRSAARDGSEVGGDVALADVERRLDEADAAGVAGDDLFGEHVHPTPKGVVEIGRLLADAVLQTRAAARLGASRPLPGPGEVTPAELLGYGPLDELRTAAILRTFYDQSPFLAGQHDREAEVERRDRRMLAIVRGLAADERVLGERLLAGELRRGGLQLEIGRLLEARGSFEAAAAAYARELESFPYDRTALLGRGRVLARVPGREPEARTMVERALRLAPDDPEAQGLFRQLAADGR